AVRSLNDAEKTVALKLLEIQRHAMLMYTSCGWFFDELSGIETLQVIQYASRALQLAQEVLDDQTEPHFVDILAKAKSNIPNHKDGAHIYQRLVRPSFVDLRKVGVHYAIRSLFEPYEARANIYCYRVQREADHNLTSCNNEDRKLIVGRVRLTSEVTGE